MLLPILAQENMILFSSVAYSTQAQVETERITSPATSFMIMFWIALSIHPISYF